MGREDIILDKDGGKKDTQGHDGGEMEDRGDGMLLLVMIAGGGGGGRGRREEDLGKGPTETAHD